MWNHNEVTYKNIFIVGLKKLICKHRRHVLRCWFAKILLSETICFFMGGGGLVGFDRQSLLHKMTPLFIRNFLPDPLPHTPNFLG